MRRAALSAIAAACLLAGPVGEATAATGELTQEPGTAGCVAEGAGEGCAAGTALGGAGEVALSPDGASAYVAALDSGGGAVAVFDRAADGALTQKSGTAGCIAEVAVPCADGSALGGASWVAVSPDGKNVYVTASSSDAVAVFDRGPNGTLTQKPGASGCVSETGSGVCSDGRALEGASSVTVSPDGSSVYVTARLSAAVAVFNRAPNGTLTQKAGTTGCISNTGTSGACVVGRALNTAGDVTLSPDGSSAYVASALSNAVAVFDRAADGTLTQKPGAAGCVAGGGSEGCADGRALSLATSVAVSPDGASAYVTSGGADAIAVFDRAADGTLIQKSGAAGCMSAAGVCSPATALIGPGSIAVSPDGLNVYATASGSSAVTVFDRAPDGMLAQKPGASGCVSDTGSEGACADGRALDAAGAVAIGPDGASAYVAAGGSDAVAVFGRDLPPVPLSPPPAQPPRAPLDTVAPLLSRLSISPSRFRAAPRGAGVSARRAPLGARVTYDLSEEATVRFQVERGLPGRRAGKRCVKPKRSNRGKARCTRFVARRGSFAHSGGAGRNSLRISGRLGGRKLPPGTYRLRAVATDAAGNASAPRYAAFRLAAG